MAGYAIPHSTHRNTIAGGLYKSSFDDWQRTAFRSVVGAPSHLFHKVFKDSPPSPKSARIYSRVTEGPEPDRGGTARVHAFRPGFGATDFAGAQICVRRTIIVHRPCNTQRGMGYFLENPSAGPKAGPCGSN